MEIIDKNENKSKAFAMSSVMKNPKLAKVLLESWDAPVGSTKNNKASAILKSIHKTNNNYTLQDGQGGAVPDVMLQSPYSNSTPMQEIQPQGTSTQEIEPTIEEFNPAKKTYFVKSVDDIMPDPKGMLGGGSPYNYTKDAWVKAKEDAKLIANNFFDFNELMKNKDKVEESGSGLNITKEKPTFFGDIKEDIKKGYEKFIKGIAPTWQDLKNIGEVAIRYPEATKNAYGIALYNIGTGFNNWYRNSAYPGLYEENKPLGWEHWAEMTLQFDDTAPADKKPSKNKVSADDKSKLGFSTQYGLQVPESPYSKYSDITDAQTESDEMADKIENPEKMNDVVPPGGLNVGKSITVEDIFNMDNETFNKWNSGLTDDQATANATLIEAVNSGMGPEAFAMTVFGNKQMMIDMGLPPELSNHFPSSGLLNEHLDDLKQEVRDRYRLDEQLNTLMDWKNRNLSVEADTSEYIRNKDEYLGKIDRMIAETEHKIAYMDTSNPYVAKRMGNYLNYLTILQGRQNDRYTNFLDLSIKATDTALLEAQNLYELNLIQVNKELDRIIPRETESFNSMKTMLKEMYTNISNQRNLLAENELSTIEQLQAAAELQKTILDNKKARAKLDDVATVDYEDVDYDLIDRTILGMEEGYEGEFWSYDPEDIYARTMETEQNPNRVLERYMTVHERNILDNASQGEFKEVLANYLPILSDYKKLYLIVKTKQESGEEMPDQELVGLETIESYLTIMANTINNGLYKGITKFLDNETNLGNLRVALHDVSGVGVRYFKEGGDEDSRNDFINKYKGKLGELAALIFDYYHFNLEANPDFFDEAKKLLAMSDSEFADKMASHLAKQLTME